MWVKNLRMIGLTKGVMELSSAVMFLPPQGGGVPKMMSITGLMDVILVKSGRKSRRR